jgi:lipopolysaccharide export system protein LptA
MKKTPLFLLLLTVCAAFASPVWAEKADRNKDMHFEADALRVDDVKQTTLFTGNVVMTKGTLLVRASRIDARTSDAGYQTFIITGTPDKPAFYRQKRDAVDEFIEVESERIDYDGSADIVKFSGKAVLRRLRGTVLADEISGAVIVYENLTDKFSVDGSSAAKAGSSAPAPGGRVRAMLTPKPEPAASAATSATKTPAQPSPNPSLRATTTLGSPPQ